MGKSLIASVRTHASTELWTDEVEPAWQECVDLITRTMIVAAEERDTPAVWTGTVIEHRRVLTDLARRAGAAGPADGLSPPVSTSSVQIPVPAADVAVSVPGRPLE